MRKEQTGHYLEDLDAIKSTEPDKIHLRILKVLADATG